MHLPKIVRRFIAHFVAHHAQHVIVAQVRPGNPKDEGPVDDRGTECFAVDSLAQFDAMAADFAGFALHKPRRWLAEGGLIVPAGVFRSSLGLVGPRDL